VVFCFALADQKFLIPDLEVHFRYNQHLAELRAPSSWARYGAVARAKLGIDWLSALGGAFGLRVVEL
jgi:hypothetical protein